MVQNSRRKLNSALSDKLSGLFFTLLCSKKDKDTFNIIIESIFSSVERIMILKRIGMIYLLLRDIKKYNIKKLLGVTRATLDKYSLIIEKNPLLYMEFKKIVQRDKIKLLFEEILSFLYGPGTTGIDWIAAGNRRKRISRKKEFGV